MTIGQNEVVDMQKVEERLPTAIICSAIQCDDGSLIKGLRHFDQGMRNLVKDLKIPNPAELEQGFVDNLGNFQSREAALKIVLANGQHFSPKRNVSKTALFSEGIY